MAGEVIGTGATVAGSEPAVLFFDADGTLVWTDESAMLDGDDFNDSFAQRLRVRGV